MKRRKYAKNYTLKPPALFPVKRLPSPSPDFMRKKINANNSNKKAKKVGDATRLLETLNSNKKVKKVGDATRFQ